MSNKQSDTPFKNPADIARETFRQLGLQRIAPTPDAYRKVYFQIAGIGEEPTEPAASTSKPQTGNADKTESEAEQLLISFANTLKQSPGIMGSFGQRLVRAVVRRDWEGYGKVLQQITEQEKPAENKPVINLVETPVEDKILPLLKDSLYRLLTLALSTLLKNSPSLLTESESLGLAVKDAQTEQAMQPLAARIKQLCFQIELNSGDSSETQELLLRLFRLLLQNIHDLLDEDNWLVGQIAVIQAVIDGPLEQRALEEATRSLKEVIYKQGVLKTSIAESKTSIKNMMSTFIERLDSMADRTGSYHNKIDGFAQQLQQLDDGAELHQVIQAVLQETHEVRSETLRSREIMVAAQREVKEAEARIKELEDKLAHMSELVREDQLTGSLNRRGLDDVFEREADRSDRRKTPLCVAMLDLDNFKKLNDTHGHAAGDEALVHLVRIVKQTLRSIDVIARYGGEEFLIVMPETTLEESAQAMTRVQRELTKHFFIANNERLLITFSAGVALRKPSEAQEETVKRADKAMYEAKRSGKNRVVMAD